MLTDQEEQAEKRRTLLNDARVREQSNTGTYLSHTHSELGGRFSNVGAALVVGTTPNPYPPLPENNPWRSDPVPNEPPLGYCIDAMPGFESSMATSSSSVEATGDPADAPSSDDGVQQTPSGGSTCERAGSSLSQTDQDENR
jgi:hypothetical protein